MTSVTSPFVSVVLTLNFPQVETSHLMYKANQSTGLYMRGTLVDKGSFWSNRLNKILGFAIKKSENRLELTFFSQFLLNVTHLYTFYENINDVSRGYRNVTFPVNIYLFKFNNRNTRKRCEICSKSLLLTLNIFHTFF